MLAEQGADGLSLRGLAAELGMAPSGVHYYFASREDLLAALVEDAFLAIAAHVQAAAVGPSPVQSWLSGARAYRRWAADQAELWQLAHSRTATGLKASPGLLPAKDAAVRALMEPIRPALVHLPRGVQPVGAVPAKHLARWARALGEEPDPPRQLVLLHLYTVLHGQVQLAVTGSLPRELLRDHTVLDAQLDLSLTGLGLLPE